MTRCLPRATSRARNASSCTSSDKPRAMPSVGRFDEQGRVAEHLGKCTDRGREHRRAHAHRLERREPEPFVAGRVREQRRTREQIRSLGVVDPSGDPDAAPVRRATRTRRRTRRCSSPVHRRVRVGGRGRWRRCRRTRGRVSPGSCAVRSCRGRGRSGGEPASRWPALGSPAETSEMPLWTTWMRSLGTPKTSATSRPTNSETVWTCAPRRSARRISAGYCTVFASQYSGWCTGVRSCTVTSSAARLAGGTTKFGPCTTSIGAGPVLDRRPVDPLPQLAGRARPVSRGAAP